MARVRISSRPTAMKCSSGVYIHPYVASSAYQSAMTVQSPSRSASRFTSSQEAQNSSISARDSSLIGLLRGLLDGQRHRRAVTDGGLHLGPPGLVGVLLEHDDPVGRQVEAEHPGRL